MKYGLLFPFLFLVLVCKAQQAGQWTDHFPYNSVSSIAVRGDVYYCATGQGMFSYDASEQEIVTYSKSKGLNDIGIKALAYNSENDVLVVGYENANIDLLTGNRIVNMGDIKRSTSYTGKKRINHITTRGDFAWLSTGFGIVQINVKLQVVAATYIIGPNGNDLEVYQTAIDEVENRMYAATPLGLYSASMSSPLIFYQFWRRENGLRGTEINAVAALNGRVFANKVSGSSPEDSVFFLNNGVWTYLNDQGVNKKYQLNVSNGHLSVVTPFTVNYFDSNFNLKYIISDAYYSEGTFQPRSAWMMPDGRTMLIGNDMHGLIISVNVDFNVRIVPNGPPSSLVFRMAAENNRMYVATGAIDELWTRQFVNQGIYELDNYQWEWITPDALNNIGDLVNVIIDPADNKHIFAAAWGSGVLEIRNGVLENFYNYQTTGGAMQGPANDLSSPRTGGIALDSQGNLWVTSSQSERPLSVRRKDGTWENFDFGSLGGASANVFDVLVNKLNQKWIRTRNQGLLVMDDATGVVLVKRITTGVGSGNLPSSTVLDFEEDIDGEIWIGTSEGLVVLYSPQNVFRPNRNFDAQPVLFEEDGVVQRLLGTEAVTAIAIDGANKKWFGTQNSGVFYTSEDGTRTIYNFTAENSPLISNSILDITIDDATGEVYFATEEGIISFRGSATRGYDEYTDVYAYPNPVRPDYEGPIFIRGLVTNARVKITDVAGNIVFETIAEGGQARWDALNLDGKRVQTGVYLAYITDDFAERTTVTKILVVR